MKLIEQIRADRIEAFKQRTIARENIKKNLLGCLIADASKEDKEPEDSKVLSVIKKFIDNAKFVMEKTDPMSYEYHTASMEVDILEAYRPKQLSAEEIEKLILHCKGRYADITLKAIMGYFKDHYAGQYDGKLVSEIAKKLL